MAGFDSIILGLLLVALGIGITFITLFLIRRVPRRNPALPVDSIPPLAIDGAEHPEAVLLIRQGGQVLYLNELAREWFKVGSGRPNLERMGRRVRPGEAFIGLCAAQGQASFSLDGRAVDGISYEVPYEGQRAVLVALRRLQLAVEPSQGGPGQGLPVSRMLKTFTEINQQIASSLELEETLQKILENVMRLVPADYMEITYWDADDQHLIPYRLQGAAGEDQHLERVSARYTREDGYSGNLLVNRQPLLITDRETYHRAHSQVAMKTYPYQSFLGIPLVTGNEVVGTIELASLARDGFNQQDQDMLLFFSEQAAIAVHNALLFGVDRRRFKEIAGLTKMAQAVSSLRDSQDLFVRLVESITPLIDVEVLGFLIYDEN